MKRTCFRCVLIGVAIAALQLMVACGPQPVEPSATVSISISPTTTPSVAPSATRIAPSAMATEARAAPSATATRKSTATATPTEIVATRLAPAPGMLAITILYDNMPYDARLRTAWGFSALVELGGQPLLFDTGGDGPNLMHNIRALGIDMSQIEGIVISHAHGDHTGGLGAVLQSGVRPPVYVLAAFPTSLKRQISRMTSLVEVEPGQQIVDGIFTTGKLGVSIPEQALVIQTGGGLVVITGCAHPGIVRIVEKAKELFDQPVLLVMGGFHLVEMSRGEIEDIIADFRRLGVQQAAPSHCTGDTAIEMFAAEYGEDYLPLGVGRVIEIPAEP